VRRNLLELRLKICGAALCFGAPRDLRGTNPEIFEKNSKALLDGSNKDKTPLLYCNDMHYKLSLNTKTGFER
jgi:hypothetical protein